MIERGTIVRVVQLGENGWKFQHPAYARVSSDRGGQRGVDFMLVDGRDVQGMARTEMYGLDSIHTSGFSALDDNLVVATEDEAAVAVAAVVLRGIDLVIIPEPVSLA